jgi:hypothetical protein
MHHYYCVSRELLGSSKIVRNIVPLSNYWTIKNRIDKGSSCGLVVKAEDSQLRGRGFKPPCEDHFSCTIHLDQSMEVKIEWKLTWHCCICCNPAKGRVDFEDGWLIKSSFKTKDEMKACQLTRTKLSQKKKIESIIWSKWKTKWKLSVERKERALLRSDDKLHFILSH